MTGLLAGLAACSSGGSDQPVSRAPGGCGIEHPLALENISGSIDGAVMVTPPASLDRQMTGPLRAWGADIGGAAIYYLDEPLSSVINLSSYSCRNVQGGRRNSPARLSRHATGLALDVSGFRLAGGRTVRVVEDWGRDTPEGRFLAQVHRSACRHFNTVLGPRYNQAHRDHFHVSIGGNKSFCR